MSEQCEYGTARAGTLGYERCEKEATETYLGYGEHHLIELCEEHYEEFHYGDFLSSRTE